jgi:hypothetical protein
MVQLFSLNIKSCTNSKASLSLKKHFLKSRIQYAHKNTYQTYEWLRQKNVTFVMDVPPDNKALTWEYGRVAHCSLSCPLDVHSGNVARKLDS